MAPAFMALRSTGTAPGSGAGSTDPLSGWGEIDGAASRPPSGPTPSTAGCPPARAPDADPTCRSSMALPCRCRSDVMNDVPLAALRNTRTAGEAGSMSGNPDRAATTVPVGGDSGSTEVDGIGCGEIVIVGETGLSPPAPASADGDMALTGTAAPRAGRASVDAEVPAGTLSAGMTTKPGASRLARTARNGSSASAPGGGPADADDERPVMADVEVGWMSMHGALATRVPDRQS